MSHYYASFVDIFPLHCPTENNEESVEYENKLKFAYEHHLFTDMKKNLVVRKKFMESEEVIFSTITCTDNLYKVFERC